MVIGPVGLRARFELSLSESDGNSSSIRVPRLVVERTDHAPRASTTTSRAKRPESVRRGAVVRRTPGSEEACSSALRTVWNYGWSNRVESRFNSIPWHTHAVARRERRPRCTRSEIVAGPFGLGAPLEVSRPTSEGARGGKGGYPWGGDRSGESDQCHPGARTCSRTKGTSSALHAVRNCGCSIRLVRAS